MAQIGITLGSAINAGTVAAQITAMNTAIGVLNALVAGPPGSPLMISMLARVPGNDTDLMAGLKLNAADSSVILNAIFQAYQTLLTQYNAALNTMVIT